MKALRGGQIARGGTYWCLATGEFITIPKEGGVLPGEKATRYIRAPMTMVIGPLMGLAFVVFLPFIGIATVGYLLGKLAWRKVKKPAEAVFRVVVPARQHERHL